SVGADAAGFSYAVNAGATTVTISHAGATDTAVNTLLNNITFDSTSDDPGTSRTVNLGDIDDTGTVGTLNPNVDATINITESNDAPTDMVFDDGVTINDGATDGYIGVNQFNEGAAASTQLTVEISFASTNVSWYEVDFLSYAVSSGSNEEINARMTSSNGRVYLQVAGVVANFTGFDGRTLFDGNQHQLSFTWADATGEANLYADGVLVKSVTVATGQDVTWATNGVSTSTLLIGQDQDSVGGGFSSNQIFSGDVFEARIYDDVRTAQEISDNTNTFLADPTADANLLGNWRMTDNGSGQITDETGNGYDLTLYNSTSFNTTLSVYEDSSLGNHVAFVTDVTDVDVGDTHTFSLTDDAGGAFAINATTGEITVADASQLDYETATTMNITVRATDSGGKTYDEVVTINIMDGTDNTAPEFIKVFIDHTIDPNDISSAWGANTSIATADWDGDGTIDAVLAGYTSWYEVNGDGTFTAHDYTAYVRPAYYITNISVGDLDGDNDLDILISAGHGGGGAVWLENDGNQDFTQWHDVHDTATPPTYNDDNTYSDIVDFDGDGDMDIVVGTETDLGNEYKWYENDDNNPGTFTTHQIGPTNQTTLAGILVADLDNDGDMDMVTSTSHGGKSIAWYLNDGNNVTFTHDQEAIADPVNIQSLELVDIDNDTFLDIAVHNKSDNKIYFLKNSGTATP
ncbi:MAG: hypothetical protein GY935_19720, partial [Gammaproteobacteria bacterium]|nr:hypothetical protein [Gammaproteobacteria bacterium]